jgi:3-methyl-2-oxobutanoate hydroxymethyltransferase
MQRTRANAIRDRKGTRFATITAYDAAFGRFAEAAGIDVILVGDSLGNVVLGYESTVSVTMEDMERHGAAVARGTHKAHVVVDMPFMSYEPSDEEAVRNAGRLIRAGASSVKLEGGVDRAGRIAAIVKAGIPVMGHIGVVPQTAALAGGFRRRTDREQMLADAEAVAAAGAYSVVLEMVDAEIAREITERIAIPTIGIGAGTACDAQILVLYDLLGISAEMPSFAMPYADLASVATDALRRYAQDVVSGAYTAHGPTGAPVKAAQ